MGSVSVQWSERQEVRFLLPILSRERAGWEGQLHDRISTLAAP